MAKTDGVNATNDVGMSGDEAVQATVCAHKGNSGTGAGISLTGSSSINCLTSYGFYPRMVIIDGAGNFGFTTLDDNPHLISVAAKTILSGIFIKTIYQASHATLATTATGVHVF